MRSAIVMLLLTIVSSRAETAGLRVEWVRISGNDTYTVYASPAIVRKSANIFEMWTLEDFKTYRRSSRGRMYLSKKMQGEYDCTKKQSRMIYSTTHREHMGEGWTVYYVTDPDDWKQVEPGSFAEYLLNWACGRR
jgi:hypothetical protein